MVHFNPEDYDSVVSFGKDYATTLGLTLEQLTIFYLYTQCNKTILGIAKFLDKPRECIRKEMTHIIRLLLRAKYQFDGLDSHENERR